MIFPSVNVTLRSRAFATGFDSTLWKPIYFSLLISMTEAGGLVELVTSYGMISYVSSYYAAISKEVGR